MYKKKALRCIIKYNTNFFTFVVKNILMLCGLTIYTRKGHCIRNMEKAMNGATLAIYKRVLGAYGATLWLHNLKPQMLGLGL